jgi:tetratricopeptide (TPR) repeat protein
VADELPSPDRTGKQPTGSLIRTPTHQGESARAGFGDAAIRRYRWLVEKAAIAGKLQPLSRAHADLGDAYACADQTVKALRQFKRAIHICPKRAESHFALAEVHLRRGKIMAALNEYRWAIELSPYNPFYHYRLGAALSDAGFDGEAVAELEVAVEMAPEDPFYHFWLADLYLMVGRLDDATAEMQQASMFSPRDSYYNLRLAVLYLLGAHPDDAVEALRRAVQLDPGPLHHCILADVHMHLGNNDAAMRHYQKAGNLDSYDREHVRRIRALTDLPQ